MGICKPSRDTGDCDEHEVQVERNPTIGVRELKSHPVRRLSSDKFSPREAKWGAVSRRVRTAGTISRATSAAHSRQHMKNTTDESSDSTYSGSNSANSVTPRRSLSDTGITPRSTEVGTLGEKQEARREHPRRSRSSSLPNENNENMSKNIGMQVPVQHKGVHQKAKPHISSLDNRLSPEMERKKVVHGGEQAPDVRCNNNKKEKKDNHKDSQKDCHHRKKSKRVTFCEVELFEFSRAGHDAAPTPKSGGPGLGMGWAAIATAKIKITEFEKMRCHTRTPRQMFHREGRLTPKERCKMLNVRA